MPQPIITIKHLRNYLGGHWVHDDINLEIFPNEIIAIVGGSGSGKTTLLRSILGLQEPFSGEINFEGELEIGMMFQHGALFSGLTVAENIAFPLKQQTKLDDKLIFQIAMLKLSLVGLAPDTANRVPSELSGGMIKRVAVARAMALDPDLLFLDEPTAGLDPHGASGFDELILQLKESLGLAVVIITHDLDTIWRITDRVIFIGEGKVLGADNVENLAQSNIPEIHDYFTGPRGRAAMGEA